jgi:hypothetical protein
MIAGREAVLCRNQGRSWSCLYPHLDSAAFSAGRLLAIRSARTCTDHLTSRQRRPGRPIPIVRRVPFGTRCASEYQPLRI